MAGSRAAPRGRAAPGHRPGQGPRGRARGSRPGSAPGRSAPAGAAIASGVGKAASRPGPCSPSSSQSRATMARVSAQEQLVVQSVFTASSKTVGERSSRPAPRASAQRRSGRPRRVPAARRASSRARPAARNGARSSSSARHARSCARASAASAAAEPPRPRPAGRSSPARPLGHLGPDHPAAGQAQRPGQDPPLRVPAPRGQVVPAVAADNALEVEGVRDAHVVHLYPGGGLPPCTEGAEIRGRHVPRFQPRANEEHRHEPSETRQATSSRSWKATRARRRSGGTATSGGRCWRRPSAS